MLTPSELMLGNLVQNENCIIQYVNWIGRMSVELSTEPNGSDDCDYRPEDIFPIPLTEQHLLDFGFERIKSKSTYNSNDEFIDVWNKDGFILTDDFVLNEYTENLVRIFYVHQLQNLYYALNPGEPLTLKTVNPQEQNESCY